MKTQEKLQYLLSKKEIEYEDLSRLEKIDEMEEEINEMDEKYINKTYLRYRARNINDLDNLSSIFEY